MSGKEEQLLKSKFLCKKLLLNWT